MGFTVMLVEDYQNISTTANTGTCDKSGRPASWRFNLKKEFYIRESILRPGYQVGTGQCKKPRRYSEWL
jgi:hypothetical protein